MADQRQGKLNGRGSPTARTHRIGVRARLLPVSALIVLVVLVFESIEPAVSAPLNAPQQVVQQVSEGLRRVLRKDRQLLESDPAYVHRLVDEIFLPNVDFPRTCAVVLGPFWKKATDAQRDAFGTEFKTLLINTYAAAINELSAWEIRYPPVRLDPGDHDVVVHTQVLYPGGEPINVDYRMHRKGEGRWLAYDVTIAGVSLLANYRSTFLRIVREKGLAGLIADLAARNALGARRSSPDGG